MHALKLIENLGENWIAEQQARANAISSYEMSAISGEDQYSSALKLWAVKTGKIPPEAQSTPMWLSLQMRPVMLKLFRRTTGQDVTEHNTLYSHPEFTFAACRPDAFIANCDDLEEIVKVASVDKFALKNWKDGIPGKHLVRAQWEMGIMGIEALRFGVLGGYDFETFQADFDRDLFDQLLQLAVKFLECVKQDVPPNAGPGDRELINRLIGGVRNAAPANLLEDKEASDLCDRIRMHQDKRKAFSDQADEHDEERKRLENLLLQKMGKSSEAYTKRGNSGGQFKITAKRVNRNSYMVKPSSFTQMSIK
jgi:predicted phage-related endonuclease